MKLLFDQNLGRLLIWIARRRKQMGKMKIRYENNLEDLVAFNRYHFAHSPTMRRMKILLFLVFPLCFVLCFVPLALMEGRFEVLAGAGAIAAIYAFIGPWFYRRSMDRQFRKLYSEGTSKGVLGEHELELTQRDLIERTLCGEQRTRVEAIERVVSDNGYTFIYLGAIMAHVVPQDAVFEGDYQVFVERLKERVALQRGE